MTETRRQSAPTAKPRRLVSGLSVLGLSLFVLAGCAVPGGYDVNSLHLQPESALVYPGSTDVHTNYYNGSPGNYVSKGAVASIGNLATTIHTQLEVLAFFSKTVTADGWTQNGKSDQETTPEGLPASTISWGKQSLHLSYSVEAWREGETTKYWTRISSDE